MDDIQVTIEKASEPQNLVFGWASVIEENGVPVVDRQGDMITEDELERAAYSFAEDCRKAGEMHTTIGVGELVESVVLTKAKQDALGIDLGKIGWWVGFRLTPEVFAKVADGTYRAFSIGGTGQRIKLDVEDAPVAKADKPAKMITFSGALARRFGGECPRPALARVVSGLDFSKAASFATILKTARWPAGASNGGQFKGGGSGTGYSMFGGGKKQSGPLSMPTGPVKAKSFASSLFDHWDSGPSKAKGPIPVTPPPPPPEPTSPKDWGNPSKIAIFRSDTPASGSLNGVQFAPWLTAPRTADGWQNVTGQNHDLIEPELPIIPGKHAAAGVVIREPDGRVWVVEPTKHFGGYKATFPKGTAEDGIPSLQANAIKEAFEESGLQVKITGHLGDYERDTSVARYYTAERVGGSPSSAGWESQSVQLVPPSDISNVLNRAVDHGIASDAALHASLTPIKKFAQAETFSSIIKSAGFPRTVRPASYSDGAVSFAKAIRHYPAGSAHGGQFMPKEGGPEGLVKPISTKGAAWENHPNSSAKWAHKKIAALDKLAETNPGGLATVDTAPKSALPNSYQKEVHAHHQKLLAWHAANKAKAEAAPPPRTLSIQGWAKIGQQLGSNKGGTYTGLDGKKWYVKEGATNAHAHNEVLADRLLEAAGVPTLHHQTIDLGGGKKGVASPWQDKGDNFNPKSNDHKLMIAKHFAAHAWIANWDAVGPDNTNTAMVHGKLTATDTGGGLLYRAQGDHKGAAFGTTVGEWNTMRDKKGGNPHAAAAFGKMTSAQLIESAKHVEAISPEHIKKLVSDYGPGTHAERLALADKMIARRADIVAKASALKADLAGIPPATSPPAKSGHFATVNGEDGMVVHLSHSTDKPGAYNASLFDGDSGLPVGHAVTGLTSIAAAKAAAHKMLHGSKAPASHPATGGPVAPKLSQPGGMATTILGHAQSHLASGNLKELVAMKTGLDIHAQINGPMTPDQAAVHSYVTAAVEHLQGKAPPVADPVGPMKPVFPATDQSGAAWSDASAVHMVKAYINTKNVTALENAIGVGLQPTIHNYAVAGLAYAKAKKAEEEKPPRVAPAYKEPAPSVKTTGLPQPEKVVSAAKDASVQKMHDNTHALGLSGDVAGLQKLQAKYAATPPKQSHAAKNAAQVSAWLAHLGSTPSSAPTLTAAVVDQGVAAPKAKSKKSVAPPPRFQASKLTEPPDFTNYNNTGKGLSSHAEYNVANNSEVAHIKSLAMKGTEAGLAEVKAYVVKSPAKDVNSYKQQVWEDLHNMLHPPVPLEEIKLTGPAAERHATVAKSAKALKTPDQVTDKVSYYPVLAKVADPESLRIAGTDSYAAGNLSNNTYAKAALAGWSKLNLEDRKAVESFTGGGFNKMNLGFRSGSPTLAGKKADKAIRSLMHPIKPGTVLSRKVNMTASQVDAMVNGSLGKVIQEFGISSTSINPSNWGGNVHIKMVVGNGVSGLYVGPGSEGGDSSISMHPGEQEITLPANCRMLVTKITPAGQVSAADKAAGWGSYNSVPVIEVVVLPN